MSLSNVKLSMSCPTDEVNDSTLESLEQISRADCDEQILADVSESVEEAPNEYVSIRLTTKHTHFDDVVKHVLYDFEWYISYPHFGKTGKNEHFHIFVPGNKSAAQRLRDRLKKLNYTGNKHLSIECNQNGIKLAIKYGSREKTTPFTKGDLTEKWIEQSPKWLECNLQQNLNPDATIAGKRKRDDENGIKITDNNVMRLS